MDSILFDQICNHKDEDAIRKTASIIGRMRLYAENHCTGKSKYSLHSEANKIEFNLHKAIQMYYLNKSKMN